MPHRGVGVKHNIAHIIDVLDPHKWINKFGYNADIDSAAAEDVWGYGGKWVAPTQARTHQIVSTSTNDDGNPVGTGARTVKIFGLDANFDEIAEILTLDGITNVPTTKEYTRIYRMEVKTAGSGGSNAGTITATADTDGTVTSSIGVGDNQSQMAIYTIPRGYEGRMKFLDIHIDPTNAVTVTLKMLSRKNGSPWRTRFRTLHSNGAPSEHHEFFPGKLFEEREDIVIEITSSVNNLEVSSSFDLELRPIPNHI